MYELTKKKSIGVKIILTLIVLFIITQVLKIFLGEPRTSINDDLMKMASEINQHAPVMVDSVTRFDNAVALSNNTFQYNYTLLKAKKSEIETTYLQQAGKEIMLNKVRTSPKMAYFRDNNISIWGAYYDSTGVYICTVRLSHDEIKK